MLTQKRVRELLDYDPQNGNLIWKNQRGGVARSGDLAGYLHHTGYNHLGIDEKKYITHRVIFLWHHGYMPKYIDHINRIKSDNRIGNLRECTSSQNHANVSIRKDNTSRKKGVTWHIHVKQWQSRISKSGKRYHLGYFNCPKEAHEAYCVAAVRLFGEFARF